MWKAIYAVIVLSGALSAVVYGLISLTQGNYGYAIGYTILLILAVPTMWIVGASIFNSKEKKEEEVK